MLTEIDNPDVLRDGLPRTDPDQQQYGEPEEGGDLYEMQPAERAKAMNKRWDNQDPFLEPLLVQWRVNRLRRRGVPNVKAQVREGVWFVWKQPGITSPDSVPSVNMAADLCRKKESFLWSDPPKPEALPASNEDEDAERAILGTRILEDVQGPAVLNDVRLHRRAWSRGASSGSGFVYYYVDPKGGGLVPMAIQGGFDPVTGLRSSSVQDMVRNPLTGMPWPDFQRRYVMQDGTLTDKPDTAAKKWQPRIKAVVLTGANVRMIPHTADEIGDAEGAMIGRFITVREAKKLDPELWAEITAEGRKSPRVEKVLSYRPPKFAEDILGAGYRKADLQQKESLDESLVWCLELYFHQCPDYPQGMRVRAYGETESGEPMPWVMKNGALKDLPLAQQKGLSEGREGPYGVGDMEILGPGNEVLIAATAAFLEVMEKTINRKTFIPTTSPVHPRHLQNPSYRYLPVMPGQAPTDETVPALPQVYSETIERFEQNLRRASSMNETSEGLEAGGVDSGRHAYAIVNQVIAILSEQAQNAESGYVRGSRIQLQLIRDEYTDEQQLKYKGDDGAWMMRSWQSVDLGDTTDVQIRPGSMTQLSMAQKEMQAITYAQQGLIRPHQLQTIVRKNVGGRVGLEDDKHLNRILGQLAAWKEGPPEGWQPQIPVAQLDPVTGQTVMAPPPDPVLGALFAPTPADSLPDIAAMRTWEIGLVMAEKKYLVHPPAWREALDMEFYRMVAASAPAPQPAPAEAGGASRPPQTTTKPSTSEPGGVPL